MTRGACCPVCGEGLADQALNCEACGSILPGDFWNQSPPEESGSMAPGTMAVAAAGWSPDQVDELARAFSAQFEGRGLILPARWVDRLRSLATQVEQSRRFATVAFVDLRGYTAISRQLDGMALEHLRQWFYGLVTRRVEQYGGFVVKFQGDAVLAAFGAPWAFERDQESALRAMLDVRNDVRSQASFQGFPLAVRCGLDNGVVEVRLTDVQGQIRWDLFGDPVNLASRLQDHSETWDILISDQMASEIRHGFVLEARPSFMPKNYGSMIEPWAVAGVREDGARQRRRHDVPFVGRDRELKELLQALESRHRQFQDIRLLGGAGLGKSRLLLEARRELLRRQPDCPWSTVECEPHDRFAPLKLGVTLVRQLLEAVVRPNARPTSEGAPWLDHARMFLHQHPMAPVILPTLGYLLQVEPFLTQVRSTPPATLRTQALTALVIVVQALAEKEPLVLVVDDAQWCDQLTCDFLKALREARPTGVALVTLGREEVDPEPLFDHPPTGQGTPEIPILLHEPDSTTVGSLVEGGMITLSLGPLDFDSRNRLWESVGGDQISHPLVVHRILEDSEGIPFVLVELGSVLSHQADVLDAESLTNLTAQEGRGMVTQKIQGILQARVDGLKQETRSTLQSAAVLGRRFSYSILALFARIRSDLLAQLYMLKGLQMLEQDAVPEDLTFFFTPKALRNAAYEMLTKEQRIALHLRVAQLIEQHFPERKDDFVQDLALHYVRGQDLSGAMKYLRIAVDRAIQLGAPQDAYELVRGALQLEQESPVAADGFPPREERPGAAGDLLVRRQQRGLLLESAGRASRVLGDLVQSNHHFREWLSVAEALGNGGWCASARQQLAVNALALGQVEESLQLLEEASSQEQLPDHVRLRIASTLGEAHFRQGRRTEAMAIWRDAGHRPGLADRSPSIRVQADCVNNLAVGYLQQEEWIPAEQAFTAARDIWQRQNMPYGMAACDCNLGVVYERQGRLREADQAYARAADSATATGNLLVLSSVEINRANVALILGDHIQARDRSSRALQLAQAIRHSHLIAVSCLNLGLALGALGLAEDALLRFDQGRLACAGGDLATLWELHLAEVSVRLLHGRENARADLERLAGLPQELASGLEPWRETLEALLHSVESGRVANLLQPAEVQAFARRADVSLENRVRRVDGVILLQGRGLNLSGGMDEWKALRHELTEHGWEGSRS